MQLGRRNIFLGIIALGIVAAAVIFKTDGTPQHIFSPHTENLLVSDTVRNTSEKDSDNDGVPDWKEAVEGTDPQNPDTFNTEGGDSAYIASRAETRANGGITYEPSDNVTEQVSRGVFGEYLYARVGDTSNFSSPEELVAYITNKTLEVSKPTVYTKADFTVVNTNRSTLLAYADQLRAIDQKYPDNKLAEAGLQIIQTFVTSGDANTGEVDEEALHARIDPYLSIYTNIVGSLRGIAVPDLVINEHINLTNSVAGIKWSLEETSKTNTDPARALVGIQAFPEYANLIDSMYAAIVRKLQIEGVPL